MLIKAAEITSLSPKCGDLYWESRPVASIAVQGQVNFKLNERGPCPCLFITSAEKVYSIFPIETKDINL